MPSPELRTVIGELIEQQLHDPDERPFVRDLIREHDALLLFGSFSGWHLLRRDGSVVFVPDGPDDPARLEPDERWTLVALVRGVRRWPRLAPLLPQRELEPNCPACEGRGHLEFSADVAPEVICGTCAGLGWVADVLRDHKL